MHTLYHLALAYLAPLTAGVCAGMALALAAACVAMAYRARYQPVTVWVATPHGGAMYYRTQGRPVGVWHTACQVPQCTCSARHGSDQPCGVLDVG